MEVLFSLSKSFSFFTRGIAITMHGTEETRHMLFPPFMHSLEIMYPLRPVRRSPVAVLAGDFSRVLSSLHRRLKPESGRRCVRPLSLIYRKCRMMQLPELGSRSLQIYRAVAHRLLDPKYYVYSSARPCYFTITHLKVSVWSLISDTTKCNSSLIILQRLNKTESTSQRPGNSSSRAQVQQ
jgi:hypothetical protein